MFKKFLMATAVMLSLFVLAKASDGPLYGTPRGGPQALPSADYGGVSYSTCAFCGPLGPINFSTVAAPNQASDGGKTGVRGVFYGILFSSGSTPAYDFVDVYDASSAVNANQVGAFARVYNVNGSSMAPAASGFSGPPKPIRFNRGLVIRPGSATNAFNNITTLYYREP